MSEQIPTPTPTAYVERPNGERDRWENAMPIVNFDTGLLRIEHPSSPAVYAYYAPGQWAATYTSEVMPARDEEDDRG